MKFIAAIAVAAATSEPIATKLLQTRFAEILSSEDIDDRTILSQADANMPPTKKAPSNKYGHIYSAPVHFLQTEESFVDGAEEMANDPVPIASKLLELGFVDGANEMANEDVVKLTQLPTCDRFI